MRQIKARNSAEIGGRPPGFSTSSTSSAENRLDASVPTSPA
jgi:hypothetical protein